MGCVVLKSPMKRQKNRRTKDSSAGRIADRATLQGGIVSLDQLRDEGVSRQASKRAKAASLHRVHRGVYAVGHRLASRITHLRAALLACGKGAVISHGTAAALHGFWDHWPHLIDVTVPVEAGRKIDKIRCRRCRYPEPEEIEVRHGLAVTTPARTLVDLAGIADLAALRKTVGRAAIRKRLDVQAVDVAIHNAKGRRGLKKLALALLPYRTKDGKAPDVRSDFETLVLPDLTPTAFQSDRRRDQFLAAAGYRVLRVTWHQIHGERAAVLERIGRAVSPRRRR